jgi:electron transport complex protein RnfG
MKRPRFSIPNASFLFLVVSFISITILGTIHHFTKEKSTKIPTFETLETFKDVLPLFENVDTIPLEFKEGEETIKVYKAYDKSQKCVGAIVCSTSHNGYVGEIDVLIGFNSKGEILNYRVLRHKETTGLGARIVNWFKSKEGKHNIIGVRVNETNLSLVVDGGEIDAVTGATVSARAFLFAVRNAYLVLLKKTTVFENSIENDTVPVPTQDTDTTKISTLKGGPNE